MRARDPFWFTAGPAVWVGDDALVATVGARIADRKALFATLAEQLDFPDGPEADWDGLVQRLAELDWLAVDTVAVVHLALPKFSDDMLAVYLDALRRALDARADALPRLVVAFPTSAWPKVASLLAPG